jgi:hypothetical protein
MYCCFICFLLYKICTFIIICNKIFEKVHFLVDSVNQASILLCLLQSRTAGVYINYRFG